jgi:hypothetical protein
VPRSALTKTVEVALTSNGLNLTDATYVTMSTGAGNGVTFDHDGADLVVLRNDTGGNATYTIKVPAPASLTAVGATVGDITITVVTAKIHAMRLPTLFKQSDGKVYIDCDVAAKILVLDL